MDAPEKAKTKEFVIKKTGSDYINLFMDHGVGHTKAKLCAVTMVEQMKINFRKNYRPDNTSEETKKRSAQEFSKKLADYDLLIRAIKAY